MSTALYIFACAALIVVLVWAGLIVWGIRTWRRWERKADDDMDRMRGQMVTITPDKDKP
jgi:hypothetical protein